MVNTSKEIAFSRTLRPIVNMSVCTCLLIKKLGITKPMSKAALIAAAPVCALLAACNGAELLKSPQNMVAATTEALGNVSLPQADGDPIGSPIEIYTRIGRGAGLCWFGTHGELKRTHIFYAEAAPPAKGGRSDIVLHERDPNMPNPRGNRAFHIHITPAGDNATLEIENLRFPLEVGQRMTADVRRWARDDLTCSSAPATKGWDSHPTPAPISPPTPVVPRGVQRKV